MKINKEEVLAKIEHGHAVLINVLSKDDFRKLRIKGSTNQYFNNDDAVAFSKGVEETYGKDKSFIVYGDHFGHLQSFEAAQALKANGMKVLNYAGGVQEWYKSGYPVEGTEVNNKGGE
jgi:rhodanese-related sulfurtransferase